MGLCRCTQLSVLNTWNILICQCVCNFCEIRHYTFPQEKFCKTLIIMTRRTAGSGRLVEGYHQPTENLENVWKYRGNLIIYFDIDWVLSPTYYSTNMYIGRTVGLYLICPPQGICFHRSSPPYPIASLDLFFILLNLSHFIIITAEAEGHFSSGHHSFAHSVPVHLFGWNDILSYPVIAHKSFSNSWNNCKYPAACSFGTKGWILAKPGRLQSIISVVPFNFIVHEPCESILRFD